MKQRVELADALQPGLVLMDINLPGINGIEATRRITAAHPDAVVVLLSTYQAADLPADAGSCGAATYVHKEELGPDARSGRVGQTVPRHRGCRRCRRPRTAVSRHPAGCDR